MRFFEDSKIDYIEDSPIVSENSIVGSKTQNYLQNLETLNEISDRFIMHFVSLLMNQNLINSEFIDYDLELLKNVSDVSLFMDLYRFVTNEISFRNPFHKLDIELLSKISNSKIRRLLLEKMTDEYSLKSQNRDFDLKYISNLDVDSIKKEILIQMRYFLFLPAGIDANNHQESLKSLYQGIYVASLEEIHNNSDREDYFNEINSDNKKRICIFTLI